MSKQVPFSNVPARRSTYEWSWARVVSDVVSPPVVWAALSFPLAFYAEPDSNRALTWALIYILFVCVLPIVYIALMVKRGRITDIHIRVRRQRVVPYLITIVCAGVASVLLWALNAPPLVTYFSLFSMLQIIIMLVVTLKWQISMHALGITSAVVAIGSMYGLVTGLLFSPLIPLVGAARVVLKRHTVAQVIAGASVGTLMTLVLFRVVN